jgi:hypothetical protein
MDNFQAMIFYTAQLNRDMMTKFIVPTGLPMSRAGKI